MITQDELKAQFRYDAEDGGLYYIAATKKFKVGDKVTRLTPKGYLEVTFKGRPWLVHRLAWLYMTGELPKAIDHENRNKADNRWTNLRIATGEQNARNIGPTAKNKSGVVGVHQRKGGKWKAEAADRLKQTKGKSVCLGTYATKELATIARALYAEAQYREFAVLPEGLPANWREYRLEQRMQGGKIHHFLRIPQENPV